MNDKLTELGGEIEVLGEDVLGEYIAFDALPTLKMNVLDRPIRKGRVYVLDGMEADRSYFAYYVNDASSNEYVGIQAGENIAHNDIVAIYVGQKVDEDGVKNNLRITVTNKESLRHITNILVKDVSIKNGYIYPYANSSIDINSNEFKVTFPKDWVIVYKSIEKNKYKYFSEDQTIDLTKDACQSICYNPELDKIVASPYALTNKDIVFLFTINPYRGICSLPCTFYTVNGKKIDYDDTELRDLYNKVEESLGTLKESLQVNVENVAGKVQTIKGYYLQTSESTPVPYETYVFTRPIRLNKDTTISAILAGTQCAVIAKVDLTEQATDEELTYATYTPLVLGTTVLTDLYSYTAEEDMFVVLSRSSLFDEITYTISIPEQLTGELFEQELNKIRESISEESPAFLVEEEKKTLRRLNEWKGYDKCLVFPILTDLHPVNNAKKYKFIDYLVHADDSFGFNYIAHLGDVGDNTDTTIDNLDSAIGKLDETARRLGRYKGKILFAQGNHDQIDGKDFAALGRDVVENYMMLPSINRYPGMFEMNYNHQCGYYDDIDNKVRTIIVNTSDTQNDFLDINSKWTNYWMTKEQMEWFASTLKNTPDGYLVLVMSHWCPVKVGEWLDYLSNDNKYAFGYTEHTSTFVTLMEAFASKSQGTINGVAYDFSGINARLIGHLCGDSHFDAMLKKDQTITVKKNVGGVISDVQLNGNGVNYVVFQGFGNIAGQSIPSWARRLAVDPDTEVLFDVVAIKPEKGIAKVFRLGKGGAEYDREFIF